MRAAGGDRKVDAAWLLLLVPLMTYLLSYLVMAAYHQRLWLGTTVIHESGRLTLLETTFYASHFLGHTPVLVTIAFLFAGFWLTMTPAPEPVISGRWTLLVAALMGLLLVIALVIGIGHFGFDDTFDFLRQRKQRPDLLVEGGSWNLHLPSTMLQFLLIPVTVWVVRRLFGRSVVWSLRGLGWLVAAIGVATAFTWLANSQPLAAVAGSWRDPRYLAHSVRELATFPLTYYPLAMAALLAAERPAWPPRRADSGANRMVIAAAAVFLIGFGYQVTVSLANDVGSMAQRPEFAGGNQLSIAYLLSSHYYEHLLDSLFFALLTIFLVAIAGRDESLPCRENSTFDEPNPNTAPVRDRSAIVVRPSRL